MANYTANDVYSRTRSVITLHAKVTIGASGAPTLVADKSLGTASITRDSAGVYIMTLSDTYNDLLDFSVMQEATTAEDLTFQIEEETVSSTKTVKFQCKAAAVETDPSSGSTLRIRLEMKNTNIK